MAGLNLKPTDKQIKRYFARLGEQRQLGLMHEGSVAPAFADLLSDCARRLNYTLSEQYPHGRLRFDGAILTDYKLRVGVWEAEDEADDLEVEIRRKFEKDYPDDNILFQAPDRAVLIQNGSRVGEFDLTQPEQLARALEAFLSYRVPAFDDWEQAVAEFKGRVPEIARSLIERIDAELTANKDFKDAFGDFYELAKTSLNPNLSAAAVKEMIVQHLMTERIFRKVFDNPDFVRRNTIAAEIERVVEALVRRRFNREGFFEPLEPFYRALEEAAATIRDYSEKQGFLNTVYEQFLQGFSVKTADTHGIVYTPQPIVSFMVQSVADILRREWGRGLEDEGVHILDPFVGTGNFILRVMEEIRRARPSALPYKYRRELHANEIMLLPYYIASMNIEHAYYEAMATYEPFPGICLVDTFELYEGAQRSLPGFGGENVARVQAQQQSPIFVVIGNPPYNAWQVDENDNNKNRKYPRLDRRVQETYVKASSATLRNALFDPYVKAFRWASDRIGEEGVVAFVSNNSFLDNIAFDGMRQHLRADFDALYVYDLGGNVRKNPKLSGTTHNVFGIQVGVAISLLVRRKRADAGPRDGAIYYARMDEFWRRGQKYAALEQARSLDGVAWQALQPSARHVWLTEGLRDDWAELLPLGTKEGKAGDDDQTIFGLYSLGVATNRDPWVYNYSPSALEANVVKLITNYNYEVFRYTNQRPKPSSVDSFINSDPSFVSWTDRLKQHLAKGGTLSFEPEQIRRSLYRPFSKQYLYFDHLLNQRRYQQHHIFPTPQTEAENRVICVAGIGDRKGFGCLIANHIPSLDLAFEKTQCFPLYVYERGGGGYPHPPAPSPVPGEGEAAPFPHRMGEGLGMGDVGMGDMGMGHIHWRSSALWEKLKPLARQMRHEPTPAEAALWQRLRRHQLAGLHFRRQHPIDRFIVDFYCHDARLVVEVDGEIHEYTPEEDALRQAFLESLGLRVLRFRNEQVLGQIEAVLNAIEAAARSPHRPYPHPPAPSPVPGEGKTAPFPHRMGEGLGMGDVGMGDIAAIQPYQRRDNISDWALQQYRAHYGDESISKEDIFYSIYAQLHDPRYRERYAANLRRELPRVPLLAAAAAFWRMAELGRALADLHLNYEQLEPYPLTRVEDAKLPPSLRVEAMKLISPKDPDAPLAVQVNAFLRLEGIPRRVLEYKLGSRSALEWVIEQYRVMTDKRSGIRNDPNRPDDEGYIVRLIGQVVRVSLETLKLVEQIAQATQ